MADWIKVEYTTPEKPEIYAVASRLDRDTDFVFSRWFRLWRWADANLKSDGIAAGMTLADLSSIAQAPGLAEAFAAEGWLSTRENAVIFTDFGVHNGQSAKQRALNTKVQQRRRAVTPLSRSNDDKIVTREEKRRREREETPPTPSSESKPDPDRVLDGFDRFAKVYPGGQAMGIDAKAAYWEAIREGATEAFINDAAAEYAESLEGKSKFVPRPAKWLNDKRFNDDRSVWWAYDLDGKARKEAIRLYRKRQEVDAKIATLTDEDWGALCCGLIVRWREGDTPMNEWPLPVRDGIRRDDYASRALVYAHWQKRSKAGAAT